MRVLYDHQIAERQTRGGISRYFASLLAELGAAGLAETVLPPLRCDNEHFRPLLPPGSYRGGELVARACAWLRRHRLPDRELYRAWRRRRARINRRAAIAALRAGAYDVFHPTYYDPYFLPHLGGKPFVVTVYDMNHEILPTWFSPGDRTAASKALLARRAARIVAISEWTAAEMTARLAIDRARLAVVHLGGDEATPLQPLAVPARYVLYVGDRNRQKNFARFARALGVVAAARPELSLVCAGAAPFDDGERRLLDAASLAGRARQVCASDGELAYLYAHAALLVYPSTSEGFGMPVVEAFAAGCPVACADRGALPEVGGDAATYFDPGDERGMAAAIARLLDDDAWRGTAVARGHRRARGFTWARVAQETAAVYAQALA